MKRICLWLAVILLCCAVAAARDAQLPQADHSAATSMAELGLMLLDEDSGVSVLAVRDRSPADRAGIRPGDTLTTANGTPFHTIEQLERLLHAAMERSLLLQLQRRPQEEIILVRLILH